MPIIEPAIRPPAEADSFLLQVTLGCSADSCTFCGAYKNKPFRVKDPQEVAADIRSYARRYPDTRRVFLMDGDALSLSNDKILPVLKNLEHSFPRISRISSYANGKNITRRSPDELTELYQHKLSLIYMGLESGSQLVLDRCKKSSSVEEMVEAVTKASCAGIKSSIIVLLGLGGTKNSREHVAGTVAALNRMQPRYLSFLSLMVIPGTPLAHEVGRGDFEELNSAQLLQEAYAIISGLTLTRTIFRSDHASNYLALAGSFPKDKEALMRALGAALNGEVGLRPEIARGL
ncbi:MAG: radical SAM protein [Candidatus Omnitrophota bacterium]